MIDSFVGSYGFSQEFCNVTNMLPNRKNYHIITIQLLRKKGKSASVFELKLEELAPVIRTMKEKHKSYLDENASRANGIYLIIDPAVQHNPEEKLNQTPKSANNKS